MSPSAAKKVSIITPSFNQAGYLRETMKSVLSQDYPNLEYIVVDGGSTDGSVEVILDYADHLAWWVSEPDRGQSDGINKGFRHATGEYVGWLNSDDIYLPGTVARAAAALDANPDAAFVYGDVYSIDAHGKTFNTMKYGDWNLRDLMRFSIIGQPAVFMRRELLEKAGFLDLQFHYLMDHHLWLRLAQMGEMVHVPEFWAKARYHASAKNIAKAGAFGMDAYRLVGWMRSNTRTRVMMEEQQFWKSVEAHAHRFDARYQLDAGDVREALAEYWRSYVLSPRAALIEWHRILYALASLLGGRWLKSFYLGLRSVFKRGELKL
ncbi:MAG: glycosyltransferase [Anaerolineaceae bacterium]|nr:glycosyltransferase [Anaerolineaceae bacterium]